MSETAVVGSPRPEPVEQELTWRDAVTPASRGSRRRWTAIYPLLLAGGGVAVAAPDLLGLGEDSGVVWGFLASMAVVFGMLRRGTRRLTAVDHPELDERDVSARAEAFRAAYPLLLAVLILSLVALFVVLPDIDRITRDGPNSTGSEGGFFLTGEALVGLLLWGFLWAVFLPTGVLAWREPDALDSQTATGARGVSEPVRDALLASALAVGMGASLVSDSSFWTLLALLLTLTTLGGVARRSGGRPTVSAATKGGLGAAFLILEAVIVMTWAVGGSPVLDGLVLLLPLVAGLTLIALAFRGR